MVDGAITYEKGTAKAPPVGLSSMFEELMKTPDEDDWRDGIFQEDYLAQEDEPEDVEPEEGALAARPHAGNRADAIAFNFLLTTRKNWV